MAKRFVYALVLGAALYAIHTAGASDLEKALAPCAEHSYGGWPVGAEGTPLCREGYAVLHDDARRVPAWSAYRLTALKATACLDRTDNFRPDENVPTSGRAQLADYRGSGYDRGHIVPAGNMQWSPKAMSESLLLSNMAPQLGSFNRGIWKQLETRVRIWARDRGELIVVDVLRGTGHDDRRKPRGRAERVLQSCGRPENQGKPSVSTPPWENSVRRSAALRDVNPRGGAKNRPKLSSCSVRKRAGPN